MMTMAATMMIAIRAQTILVLLQITHPAPAIIRLIAAVQIIHHQIAAPITHQTVQMIVDLFPVLGK